MPALRMRSSPGQLANLFRRQTAGFAVVHRAGANGFCAHAQRDGFVGRNRNCAGFVEFIERALQHLRGGAVADSLRHARRDLQRVTRLIGVERHGAHRFANHFADVFLLHIRNHFRVNLRGRRFVGREFDEQILRRKFDGFAESRRGCDPADFPNTPPPSRTLNAGNRHFDDENREVAALDVAEQKRFLAFVHVVQTGRDARNRINGHAFNS